MLGSLDIHKLQSRLAILYPDQADKALELVKQAIARAVANGPENSVSAESWSARDVVLITYGDQLSSNDVNPLQTLHRFLTDWQLPKVINTVHFLPCFPYTSDDGFSVVDYRAVDPNLGAWDDLHQIGRDCNLMLDFVVNHVSQRSAWFRNYLEGNSPYDRFFIEVDPEADVSMVTRPRSLPLLSDFETTRGKRWLWTTFSRDQVDLNFAEPAVLATMLEILLEYASHGATIIRLDAIAYLWKRLGTSCIHLPEVHEVVKLFRDVFDAYAPQVKILTETNVPHEENISYFGDGDEAHMVYQFSLPPLLLDAFLNQDATPLKTWLAHLQTPPSGTTFFNFTASHDGIGVRPLEGRIDEHRLSVLVEKIRRRGGRVSMRRNPDGTESAYEMNISYVSALAPDTADRELHAHRFLTSQAVMMALQGVPAIYFHSLVGTENDLAGVEASGIARRINRRKFSCDELNEDLFDESTLQYRIFTELRKMLQVRTQQSAFSPEANQRYVESGSANALCFERTDASTGESILVAANFADSTESVTIPDSYHRAVDLLGADFENQGNAIKLRPAQTVWLKQDGN